METFTWQQLAIIATIIFSIASSTGYLTRLVDKKLNIVDYEKRHENLRGLTNDLLIRISLLEERYNNVKRVLDKNGFHVKD